MVKLQAGIWLGGDQEAQPCAPTFCHLEGSAQGIPFDSRSLCQVPAHVLLLWCTNVCPGSGRSPFAAYPAFVSGWLGCSSWQAVFPAGWMGGGYL